MTLRLWIVLASNKTFTELTHVYAQDEQHARELARSWLEKHAHLPEHELRECPHGFQFQFRRLPGTIEHQ